MSAYTTLSPEVIESRANAATVTLQGAETTVEVIDLAKRSNINFSDYLENSIPTPTGIVSMLEALASERQTWERNELAASRTRLYAILTQCYEFYLAMKSPATAKGVRKQLADGLDMFIRGQGLRTLAKTHDMNKVVKAVFGEDRRRVSAYAMALRAALTAGPDIKAPSAHVPAANLASWIEAKGGVEEIRLGSKNNGLTEKERAEVARAAVEDDKPLMTFKPDPKVMQFSADDADKMLVLVVTYRPTGDIEVNTVVKNDSVVRAALAAYYATHKEELSDTEQVQAAGRPSAVSTALSN